MNDEITGRQAGSLCAISMLALKLVTLPSILYQLAKTSGLVSAFCLFLIDFFGLYLILRLKQKFPNLSLYDLLNKTIGKVLAKAIYIIIYCFMLLKLIFIVNEAVSYTQAIVDEEFSNVMFLMCFLPVISAVAHSGLKSTARTCEVGFIFVILGLIVCLFLSETTTSFMKLSSIFESSPLNILSSSFSTSIWFVDFLFLLIIMDKIKIEKDFTKRIFNLIIFVFIILSIFYFIYFRLFRNTAFLHKNAIADVTQYNRNIGNVGNIDIISILVYLFVIYFQGAIYMSCMRICFEKIIGQVNPTWAIIFTNIVLIILQFFIFYNLERTIDFYMSYFKFIWPLLWLIIVLLSFMKGENKNVRKVKSNIKSK